MAREPGDVVRHEPAEAPASAAAGIVALTGIELIFLGLFIAGILLEWNTPLAQQILTFWMANALLALALILTLYRRFFLDDIVVVKQRKQKWEDLL